MNGPYRLYGRAGSGSWVVQVALEELNLPYEQQWVGRDESGVGELLRVAPTGKVPVLVLPDGTSMFESGAMLIHLAQLKPGVLAPPAGTSAHALFLQWIVFLSANLYETALRIYYSSRYSSRGEQDAEAIKARSLEQFTEYLGIASASLQPYLLGAQYSIADAYLHMLVSWYPNDQAQLRERLPALAVHARALAGRAAIVKVDREHGQ